MEIPFNIRNYRALNKTKMRHVHGDVVRRSVSNECPSKILYLYYSQNFRKDESLIEYSNRIVYFPLTIVMNRLWSNRFHTADRSTSN